MLSGGSAADNAVSGAARTDVEDGAGVAPLGPYSRSIEDYIKAIYELKGHERKVSSSALAAARRGQDVLKLQAEARAGAQSLEHQLHELEALAHIGRTGAPQPFAEEFAADHQETCRIIRLVLNAGEQNRYAVDISRGAARNRCCIGRMPDPPGWRCLCP